MNERNKIAADDRFAEAAKQLFDESVASLDGETQSKLNRGRQAALAAAMAAHKSWLQWAPAGGLATAAAVALVIWTGNLSFVEPGSVDPGFPEVATDMEILLTEDSFEMLEDLEFYSWIDLNAEIAGGPNLHQHEVEGDRLETHSQIKNVG